MQADEWSDGVLVTAFRPVCTRCGIVGGGSEAELAPDGRVRELANRGRRPDMGLRPRPCSWRPELRHAGAERRGSSDSAPSRPGPRSPAPLEG
jgi:hypothetical protein